MWGIWYCENVVGGETVMMIYLQLFLSFLQIGLFSFGGGYAAMPLIQSQVVDQHHWLTITEFTDLITISQMTPGPIAVNSATFVGIKIAGFGGAAVATIGCILPSCILVTGLAYIYLRYRKMTVLQGILGSLRPAVVAMIATAGLTILISAFWGTSGIVGAGLAALRSIRLDMVLIFAGAIWLLKYKHWNPILVMVLCGVMETVISMTGRALA